MDESSQMSYLLKRFLSLPLFILFPSCYVCNAEESLTTAPYPPISTQLPNYLPGLPGLYVTTIYSTSVQWSAEAAELSLQNSTQYCVECVHHGTITFQHFSVLLKHPCSMQSYQPSSSVGEGQQFRNTAGGLIVLYPGKKVYYFNAYFVTLRY